MWYLLNKQLKCFFYWCHGFIISPDNVIIIIINIFQIAEFHQKFPIMFWINLKIPFHKLISQIKFSAQILLDLSYTVVFRWNIFIMKNVLLLIDLFLFHIFSWFIFHLVKKKKTVVGMMYFFWLRRTAEWNTAASVKYVSRASKLILHLVTLLYKQYEMGE